MSENKTISSIHSFKAVIFNLAVFVFALVLGVIMNGPNMVIEKQTARIIFFTTSALFLFVFFLSAFSKKTDGFKDRGIYKYIRHPIWGAIVFILNPGIAFLFRSWLILVFCFFGYFIWRGAAESKDREMIEIFGDDYKKYQKNTRPLFPDLLKLNKPLFFGGIALVIFFITFVILNFPSLYLRNVEWEKDADNQQITAPKISRQRPPEPQILNSEYQLPRTRYDKPNSIVIEKIGIEAPIVSSAGSSDKEINEALNHGVLIFPGSKMPGEFGNVFLTGHSSTYIWNRTPYGQVFALLDKLEIGDRIIIYYDQYKYEYQITKKYVVTPEMVQITSQADGKKLTLYTCWPVGTAWKRLLVEAEQIN